jgi:hypothetical protein
MIEVPSRTRNLILALAAMGAALVAFDLLTGAEWAQMVGGLVGGLL